MVKRTPHYVPIVNEEDRFGVLNTPNAKAAVEALVPADETFRNEVPGRVAATIPFYRPISKAEDVTCPTFVVEATRDRLIPSWTVRRLVAKLNDVECLRLSIGHFDVYTLQRSTALSIDRHRFFVSTSGSDSAEKAVQRLTDE